MSSSKNSYISVIKNFIFRRKRRILFFVVSLILFFTFIWYSKEKEIPVEYLHYKALLSSSSNQSYFSKNGCQVPQLNPWDPSVLSYYSKPSQLRCKQFQENITFITNDGILQINEKFIESVKCRYRYFERNEGIDDEKIRYLEWMDFEKSFKMEKEFVEVECSKNGRISFGKSYRFQWATIIPKENNLANLPVENEILEHPSVIMIGLDSMSKGNFIRQLPETYKELEKMNFIQMNGHVKVMDNTFGNWLAIMTGKSSTSTREFKNELPDEWHLWFDDWNIIWKNFTQRNYATFFAEDRPDIGTFNYFGYLNGFKYAPVDHYFRPYWLSCYWSLIFRRSTTGCYDAIPLHKIQLQYLQHFITNYKNKRKFAWWWTQDLSHDHLNMIGVMDLDLKEFLRRNEEAFENSYVIVFSDHGHRYASIRETVVGRLEARLPFLAIKPPKQLLQNFPYIQENLKSNSKLMTTQYDLHKTLLQIVSGDYRKLEDTAKPIPNSRSYSLLQKVNPLRTCFEAHIPEDYCPCFKEIQINSSEAEIPAKIFIDYANSLIEKHSSDLKVVQIMDQKYSKEGYQKPIEKYKCAPLKLKSIKYASISLPPPKLVEDPQVKNEIVSSGIELSYRVTVECEKPSEAIIEGVVIKNLDKNEWRATGEIERNNKYGNTSHCVADRVLKKLCHCLLI
uniref:Uncharacterized protein n=1 Tax=Panagrolaimus sp. PS1159 TaxID=55785 RepID=A0AC35F4D2_9BILA